jgi:hypothetical protein
MLETMIGSKIPEQQFMASAAVSAMLNASVFDGGDGHIKFADCVDAPNEVRVSAEKVAGALIAAEMTFAQFMQIPQARPGTWSMQPGTLRFSPRERSIQRITRAVDDFCALIGHTEPYDPTGRAKGQMLLMQMDEQLEKYFGQRVVHVGRSA